MVAQSVAEQERSVSAPAGSGRGAPNHGPGSGGTYKQGPCEVVERRAEVGAGRSSDDRGNNRNPRSEGPVAGCGAWLEGLWASRCQRLFTHPP